MAGEQQSRLCMDRRVEKVEARTQFCGVLCKCSPPGQGLGREAFKTKPLILWIKGREPQELRAGSG